MSKGARGPKRKLMKKCSLALLRKRGVPMSCTEKHLGLQRYIFQFYPALRGMAGEPLYNAYLSAETPNWRGAELQREQQRQESKKQRQLRRQGQQEQSNIAPAVVQVVAPTTSVDVNSDEFLSSYDWRRVRMIVLKRDGAKCSCCGATPATGAVMNVDHIKPRRLFPKLALDPSNLQVLCNECNHGKGNWDQTDWRGIHAA